MVDREMPEQNVTQVMGLYANGFELRATFSDFSILLMVDGQPISRLSLSYTSAKALAEALHEGVEQVEKVTGNPVPRMQDIAAAMQGAAPNDRTEGVEL